MKVRSRPLLILRGCPPASAIPSQHVRAMILPESQNSNRASSHNSTFGSIVSINLNSQPACQLWMSLSCRSASTTHCRGVARQPRAIVIMWTSTLKSLHEGEKGLHPMLLLAPGVLTTTGTGKFSATAFLSANQALPDQTRTTSARCPLDI